MPGSALAVAIEDPFRTPLQALSTAAPLQRIVYCGRPHQVRPLRDGDATHQIPETISK